jgi:hypothetical protein
MDKEQVVGWALAAAAVAVGYVQWGWRGALLAFTLIVFWLLLQFSRSLRTIRDAAGAPVGTVPSAVMLHSKLRAGMRLPEMLRLTGSLGRKVGADPESYEWADASGACLRAEMRGGRLAKWALLRPDEASAPDTAQAAPQKEG